MTGFLKRDYYLISGNLRFYALFMLCFAILAVFTDFSTSFFALYVVIFGMSSVLGLFSYDDFNHWTAYGAAAPTGRSAMVDARYLLSLLVAAGMAVIQFLLGLLGREEGVVPMTAIYSGVFLLYASLALPVSYYFGGTRARTVMTVLIALMAGAVGVGVSILNIQNVHGGLRLPPVTLLLPLAGLGALALSWRVSLGIMGRKEL